MTSKGPMAFVGIAIFVACAFAVHAQQAPDPHVADLIQSGKLRVGLGLGSPALALKDPKTGEVRGPGIRPRTRAGDENRCSGRTSCLHTCRPMIPIWCRPALQSIQSPTWIIPVCALRFHAGTVPT
jgi:hypothetical protein